MSDRLTKKCFSQAGINEEVECELKPSVFKLL